MPIYEYACDRCGHRFEELQGINDQPVTTCPKCRKRSVQRLISRTSFVLKGTGWYVTDYARKSDQSTAAGGESGSKAEKKADDKAEKRADDKAEKKAEKKTEAADSRADVSA
ncbi:MAG: zinc ribbon domain-containing protein [Myxococcota bacterium]|nr:zinc ribbon domain-containing protein [Myxococcota bacterium]